MSTSNNVELFPRPRQAPVIWLTGLPASGKTTIARELLALLRNRQHLTAAHLESDELRKILTPDPKYTEEEREWFYRILGLLALWLSQQDIVVVIDATANRRRFRQAARTAVEKFVEVYVQCPIEVCRHRDPKGIYSKGVTNASGTVPGLQDPYEEPESPEVIVHSDQSSPAEAAARILAVLKQKGWL